MTSSTATLDNLSTHLNRFNPVEPTISSHLARGVNAVLEGREKTAQLGVAIISLAATALPTYAIGKRVYQISSAWGRNLLLLGIALSVASVLYNLFAVVTDLPNERKIQKDKTTVFKQCFDGNRPVEFSAEKLKKMDIETLERLVSRTGKFTAPISLLGPIGGDLFVVLNVKDEVDNEEQIVYKMDSDSNIEILRNGFFKILSEEDKTCYSNIFDPNNQSIRLCTRSEVASS